MHVTTRDAKVIDRFARGPEGYALERFFEWYFASYGFGPVKKIHRTRQIVKTLVNHERRIKNA